MGNQLPNPYSVINMQAAFDYFNDHIENSPFEGKIVEATHRYIKILPSTEEHLRVLDTLDGPHSDSLVIHDYPLDYEILEEGDYYVEPVDENDLYYPAYTVLPVGYELPGGLPFELLADLYEPTEEEFDVETVALVFADFQEDIVADYGQEITVEELPAFLDALTIVQGKGQGIFGKKYWPRGWVHIENTETGTTHEPLRRAKISVGRWFWWNYTYTDNSTGFFISPERLRGKVWVCAKWRSYEATIRKTFNELLGFWVSDHLMTLTRDNNERTRHIYEGQDHLWFKGTVHNGIIDYNNVASQRNMDKLVLHANVWVWENGSGAASTPMLYRYRQLHVMATLVGMGQGSFWGALVTSAIGLVPPHLRPDMLFTGLENRQVFGEDNSARIQQTVFHESSHFSHARKAGSWFWANLVATEIGNDISHGDPYYDGTKPSFYEGGRIALAEGWATYVEYRFMQDIYQTAWLGSSFAIDVPNYMEGFDMYTVPMSFQTYDNKHWFLTGLFWDFHDFISFEQNSEWFNGQTGADIGDIHDPFCVTSPDDLDTIFNMLQSNTISACDLRIKLINAFPADISKINQLFTSYGYICITT